MWLWCGLKLTGGFWIYGPDPFKSQWQIIHEKNELINGLKKLKRIRIILRLYNKDFITGVDLFEAQFKEYNAVIVTQTGNPVTVSVVAWATSSVHTVCSC